MKQPFISIILPSFNEEHYIGHCIESVINSDYSHNKMELLIIDGYSTDSTMEIIGNYCNRYKFIKILRNQNRTVPFALNIGINNSSGKYIIRIDAHSEYSVDYFSTIIKTFCETAADIVGGPTRTKYKNSIQKAVAYAICSPFGIGNSKVHDENYKGYSDSVTFGAWKKEIFDEIGLFDEELIRNQDDEFHYRAKSKGKLIYQNPDIKLWYYPRDNIKSLFKQYYQYGLFKPIVLRKVKSEIKARHIIPSLFTLYILSLPFIFFNKYWNIPFILYMVFDLINSMKIKNDFKAKVYALSVYPAIHISYGLGFVKGFIIKNGLPRTK